MSGMSLVVTLQSELNELTRKRKSLESDLTILEQKINIVDHQLKSSDGNKKMMKLKEFLQTEKNRIHKNRLSKVKMQAKMLQEKINSYKDNLSSSSASQHLSSGQSQASIDEYVIKTTNFQRHQSEQLPPKVTNQFERKYHSVPTSRPHTSGDLKKYCEYCRENLIQKETKASVSSMDCHKRWSSTHLPMCMSMNVCKDCTAMRDFFLKMKHKSEEKVDVAHQNCTKNNCVAFFNGKCDSPCDLTSSAHSNDSKTSKTQIGNYCMRCKASIDLADKEFKKLQQEVNKKEDRIIENDNYKLEEMIRTCESLSVCSNCAKMEARITSVSGTVQKITDIPEQENSINTEQFDDDLKSLSASILATCESYAVCECCNHNLAKLDMPTPSPSIVALGCTSHENCSKCAEVLESSRKNSLESNKTPPKLLSHEIIYSKSFASNKSFVSIKPFQDDLTVYHPRNKLYDEIRKEIEFQSHLIFDTEEQIGKLAVLHKSDENLKQLRHLLEIENYKLEDMKKLAKIEVRKPKDDIWWEKPVVHEEIC